MKTIDIHAHLVPRSLWQAADAGREWHGYRHEPGDGLGAMVGGGVFILTDGEQAEPKLGVLDGEAQDHG